MEVGTLSAKEILALEPVSEMEELSKVEEELVRIFEKEARLYSAFVLVRRNGRLQILDGRHRREALKNRSPEEVFPVVIYEEAEVGEVKEAVAKLSTLRRTPSLKEQRIALGAAERARETHAEASRFQERIRELEARLRELERQKREVEEAKKREAEDRVRDFEARLAEIDDARAAAERRAARLEVELQKAKAELEDLRARADEKRVRELEARIEELEVEKGEAWRRIHVLTGKLKEKENEISRLRESVRRDLEAEFEYKLQRELDRYRTEIVNLKKTIENLKAEAARREERAREEARREYEAKLREVKGLTWEKLREAERKALQRFFYQVEEIKSIAERIMDLEMVFQELDEHKFPIDPFFKTTMDVLNTVIVSAEDLKMYLVEKYKPELLPEIKKRRQALAQPEELPEEPEEFDEDDEAISV